MILIGIAIQVLARCPGIKLDAQDRNGRTALHWAAAAGHTASVAALLAFGVCRPWCYRLCLSLWHVLLLPLLASVACATALIMEFNSLSSCLVSQAHPRLQDSVGSVPRDYAMRLDAPDSMVQVRVPKAHHSIGPTQGSLERGRSLLKVTLDVCMQGLSGNGCRAECLGTGLQAMLVRFFLC